MGLHHILRRIADEIERDEQPKPAPKPQRQKDVGEVVQDALRTAKGGAGKSPA